MIGFGLELVMHSAIKTVNILMKRQETKHLKLQGIYLNFDMNDMNRNKLHFDELKHIANNYN